MKIGFATTDGVHVDEHFGRAGMFAVYDINKESYQFIELRKFSDGVDRSITESRDMGDVHEDRVAAKVARLADCKIIYLSEIGGPAAARLIKQGIMPVKVTEAITIVESLEKLLQTIRTSPPPWLRKSLGGE